MRRWRRSYDSAASRRGIRREGVKAPSHELVPMRLRFADVFRARTLGALPGLERDGLPLTQ
jgi:hypothetical protein